MEEYKSGVPKTFKKDCGRGFINNFAFIYFGEVKKKIKLKREYCDMSEAKHPEIGDFRKN